MGPDPETFVKILITANAADNPVQRNHTGSAIAGIKRRLLLLHFLERFKHFGNPVVSTPEPIQRLFCIPGVIKIKQIISIGINNVCAVNNGYPLGRLRKICVNVPMNEIVR